MRRFTSLGAAAAGQGAMVPLRPGTALRRNGQVALTVLLRPGTSPVVGGRQQPSPRLPQSQQQRQQSPPRGRPIPAAGIGGNPQRAQTAPGGARRPALGSSSSSAAPRAGIAAGSSASTRAAGTSTGSPGGRRPAPSVGTPLGPMMQPPSRGAPAVAGIGTLAAGGAVPLKVRDSFWGWAESVFITRLRRSKASPHL